jgi:hypothetical protein
MGEISAAEILWDPAALGGTEVSFKSALGTVNLRGTDTVNPIHEERFGDALVDAAHGGMPVELEVPLTRTELAKLVTVLHGAITGDALTLINKAGCNALPNAKPIFIKPMCGGLPDADPKTWAHLYLCYPFRAFEIPYDRSTQRTINVIFHCFVSTESATIDKFGTIGVN